MPADSSLTFRDLILRVAELVGLADHPDAPDNQAQPPSDPHDLDYLKRAINDGRREFYRRAIRLPAMIPVLRFTLSPDGTAGDCIAGDPSRYRLPWYVGGAPKGEWEWNAPGGSTWHGRAANTHIERVIDRLNGTKRKGHPEMIGVTPGIRDNAGGIQRPGWEFRVYPAPDRAYTLQARFRVAPTDMVSDGDCEPTGADHDMTIVYGAMMVLSRKKPQDERDYWQAKFNEAVALSLAAGYDEQPKNLGVTRHSRGPRARGTVLADVLPASVNGIALS